MVYQENPTPIVNFASGGGMPEGPLPIASVQAYTRLIFEVVSSTPVSSFSIRSEPRMLKLISSDSANSLVLQSGQTITPGSDKDQRDQIDQKISARNL